MPIGIVVLSPAPLIHMMSLFIYKDISTCQIYHLQSSEYKFSHYCYKRIYTSLTVYKEVYKTTGHSTVTKQYMTS